MINNLSLSGARVRARSATLWLLVSLGACSSTPVTGTGNAILSLNQAEEYLSRGQAREAVDAATAAIAAAPDDATKVRALVLRSRARLKLGDLSAARIDARLASSSLETAFSDESGARGIWRAEVDRLVASIEAGDRRVVYTPRTHTPSAPLPRWTPPTTSSPTPGTIAIESRARWNARPIRANRSPMTNIRRITVHHTGTRFDSTDFGQSAQGILSVQRHHQDTNGWADIGYHYMIDRAGRVWEGRSIQYQGAHAGDSNLNSGNIGVCLLGDFDQQKPSNDQQGGLIRLIGQLRDKYSIPASGVYTHQELKATECPGGALSDVVDRYRSGRLSGYTP